VLAGCVLALAVTGRACTNCIPLALPRRMGQLANNALETYPGADCENMRAAKTILSPYAHSHTVKP
jgi:hypothetical protein